MKPWLMALATTAVLGASSLALAGPDYHGGRHWERDRGAPEGRLTMRIREPRAFHGKRHPRWQSKHHHRHGWRQPHPWREYHSRKGRRDRHGRGNLVIDIGDSPHGIIIWNQ